MTPRRAPGVAAIAGDYSGFLIDQFGTLIDGAGAYPGVPTALRALRAAGAVVAILSNSGRRSTVNAVRLAALGIPADAYDLLVTSGEVAWHLLAAGRVPVARRARRCLMIARSNDRSLLDGLGLEVVARAEAADLVIIAGSEGEAVPLAHYQEMLAPAARRGVPCLCLNPDRIMLTARGPAFGAAVIAETYAAMGGEVTWIGKPYREVYDFTLAALPPAVRAGLVGVGDSIAHDIAGARAAGLAAALVRTGLAAGQDEAALDAECTRRGVRPDVLLERF